MAVSARTSAVGGYAKQLLDNQDVQNTARRAAHAVRDAYQRARGQEPHKAVQDKKLRRRVSAAVTATGELLGAVSETRAKPKSRWPRRLALLTALAAGAWLISQQRVRAWIQGFIGDNSAEAHPESAATAAKQGPGATADEPTTV